MNAPNGQWRLICPAEEAQSATEFLGPAPWEAAVRVGMQLGLRVTWDATTGKLFVGLPQTIEAPKPAPREPAGVTYPSGAYLERHPRNNAPEYEPARAHLAPPLVQVSDVRVSAHFSAREFACADRSYTGMRLSRHLVETLERIRGRVGSSVVITSGYRPPEHNRRVGGVSNSTHLDGLAADIYAPQISTLSLCRICDEVVGAAGGVGYYPSQGFVHVDVRGYHSRWDG